MGVTKAAINELEAWVDSEGCRRAPLRLGEVE